MLSILFTLQYKCTAKIEMGGKKAENGGDCPKDVACSKMSAKDYKELTK